MTPLSNIVNTGTDCPPSVVCLCKWTQLMVILLKALCITYEVFFNFKAFHVCGLSNVPWISCAKYLSFDDKREIHLRKSYTTLRLRPFSSWKQIATSFKKSLFSCTYIVKIQRSHVSGCLVTVLSMSWPGHVSRVTCCPVWRARCWRGGRWRRTEASPLQHRITATSG